jgi:tRNA (cytidine/uridine-2'-O-)-methyltransferase
LFQPEIPGNTGAVGRTCVALEAKLWLVRPLGFQINEKTVRRAGLDYWQHLEWEIADHWEDLMQRLNPPLVTDSDEASSGPKRMWFFSRFATKSYTSVKFAPGDVLVFGCETAGLPKSLTEKHADSLLGIPTTGKVRSLNLATSVGVASFEAIRQISSS